MAVSPEGVIAAGTADGRLWLGFGGEKPARTSAKPKTQMKKKRKYWEGLKSITVDEISVSIASGPVVGTSVSSLHRISGFAD